MKQSYLSQPITGSKKKARIKGPALFLAKFIADIFSFDTLEHITELNFPGIYDGVAGMAFIDAALKIPATVAFG